MRPKPCLAAKSVQKQQKSPYPSRSRDRGYGGSQAAYCCVGTRPLAFIVAMAVTLLAFVAWCQIAGIPVTWYMVVGAVVLGFFVCFAAMYGFDKLKQTRGWRIFCPNRLPGKTRLRTG